MSAIDAVHSDNEDIVEEDVEDEDEGEIFEVEKILAMRFKKGKRQFLIRWKGYGVDEDSWEPEENLDGAKDVVSAYLKDIEATKSSASKKGGGTSSSKASKRGHTNSSSSGASTSQKKDSSKRRPSPKDDGDSDDEDDADFEMNSEGEEDAPLKKSKKGGKSQQKGSQKAGTQTHMEKAVARRQNLSKNMRWIEDSSDDSENGEVEEVEINDVESKSPSSNIVPDSSTDAKQKAGSVAKDKSTSNSPPTANGGGGHNGSFNDSSLKLKIAVKPDKFAAMNSQPVGENGHKDDGEKSKHKKHKSKHGGKEHSSPAAITSPTTVLNRSISNTQSTAYSFTGMYRDEGEGELCLVACDNKTKKRSVFTLEEAYNADGWSLVKYFASKVKFQSNGQVAEELEH